MSVERADDSRVDDAWVVSVAWPAYQLRTHVYFQDQPQTITCVHVDSPASTCVQVGEWLHLFFPTKAAARDFAVQLCAALEEVA